MRAMAIEKTAFQWHGMRERYDSSQRAAVQPSLDVRWPVGQRKRFRGWTNPSWFGKKSLLPGHNKIS